MIQLLIIGLDLLAIIIVVRMNWNVAIYAPVWKREPTNELNGIRRFRVQ